MLKREMLQEELAKTDEWDFIIIGGGATGLGIAVDAATRGFKTLLLEKCDYSKGTSSRSTKLVHGGVRYLEQGNIELVHAALKERGYLLKNAPHLVHKLSFIIPCYSYWEKIKYLAGLKIYDWLAGHLSFGKSVFIKKQGVIQLFPNLNQKKLVGGVQYFDGQFDDSRLAIALMRTAINYGAVVLNYFDVIDFIKENELVQGVVAEDLEKNIKYSIRGRAVINATGVFADAIVNMADSAHKQLLKPSQGVHLVIGESFLNGNHALMIPKTKDGRVLFAVPWHNHLLIGTTDTPVDEALNEPIAQEDEINFILETMTAYLQKAPSRKDIISVFAGLRPLVLNQKKIKSTKELSRDHKIIVHPSGLISIIGGKWTTYRKMAEDAVNAAIKQQKLSQKKCITATLSLHGATIASNEYTSVYGADAEKLEELVRQTPGLEKKLIDNFPYREGEVIWSVRYEMARTIEDVLARRLRILFLDAGAARKAAQRTGELIKEELDKDDAWLMKELERFYKLADQYQRYL